jgi:hypothetical protein
MLLWWLADISDEVCNILEMIWMVYLLSWPNINGFYWICRSSDGHACVLLLERLWVG